MSKSIAVMVYKLGLPVCLALVLQIVFFNLINPAQSEANFAHAKPGSGPCVNPGGSSGCYTSIQAAINAASPGDIVTVAPGRYFEHIKMRDEVSLYGSGWDSTTGTIIDGGYSAPSSTVTMDEVWAGTVLSGVQVTGGGMRDLSGPLPDGGGIFIGSGSEAVVNNTWVYSCTARWGGGILISYAKATLNNVPLWNNRAKENGGGILIQGDQEVLIQANPLSGTDGTIWFNTANQGAGIYASTSSTVTVIGTRIFWNTASGIYGDGGGVFLQHASGRVNLLLNQINNNFAARGGGLFSETSDNLEIGLNSINVNTATQAGGGFFINTSKGTIHDNWMMNNWAGNYGGGVNVNYGPNGPELLRNWIEGNRAAVGGGVALLAGTILAVDSNVFTGNRAVSAGGIYLYQTGIATITNNIIAQNVITNAGLTGGGILADGSPARLINNTIVENTGDGILLSQAENILVANNIVSHNTGGGLKNDIYHPTIQYTADFNDVYQNTTGYSGISIGAHDVELDPFFVAAGDVKTYFHLQQTSPVRHTGSSIWAPSYDIDGEMRLPLVSMGADELDILYNMFLPLVRH
jgi:parallel beta-helix repeat protein